MNLIDLIQVIIRFKTWSRNKQNNDQSIGNRSFDEGQRRMMVFSREVSMPINFSVNFIIKNLHNRYSALNAAIKFEVQNISMKVLALTLLLAVAIAQRMVISDGGTPRKTPTVNLIINGRFTYPKSSPPEYKLYKKNEVIPWHSPNMEISGIYGGYNWGWTEGSVVCELISDYPTYITQIVFIPQPGSYQFYFEWAARQNYVSTSTGSVSVGGTELIIITPTDERVYSQNITIWAQVGPLNITFASTAKGHNVSCGLTVGNIYLYQLN